MHLLFRNSYKNSFYFSLLNLLITLNMSAHVHAFLELANSGYTRNVKVNNAGDLSRQAATPPTLVRVPFFWNKFF